MKKAYLADVSTMEGGGLDCSHTAQHGDLPMSLRLALIAVAVTIAALIAIGTYYGVHPDEGYHVDAFHYFEDHWWPPELGSDDVVYQYDGWSRVYAGEIVYLVLGKLSRAVRFLWTPGAQSFLFYRLSNVVLFSLTLGDSSSCDADGSTCNSSALCSCAYRR